MVGVIIAVGIPVFLVVEEGRGVSGVTVTITASVNLAVTMSFIITGIEKALRSALLAHCYKHNHVWWGHQPGRLGR